jgi:hypothetical protein
MTAREGVLREQVRDLEPALSTSERIDEMLALEEAIHKVELHRRPSAASCLPKRVT